MQRLQTPPYFRLVVYTTSTEEAALPCVTADLWNTGTVELVFAVPPGVQVVVPSHSRRRARPTGGLFTARIDVRMTTSRSRGSSPRAAAGAFMRRLSLSGRRRVDAPSSASDSSETSSTTDANYVLSARRNSADVLVSPVTPHAWRALCQAAIFVMVAPHDAGVIVGTPRSMHEVNYLEFVVHERFITPEAWYDAGLWHVRELSRAARRHGALVLSGDKTTATFEFTRTAAGDLRLSAVRLKFTEHSDMLHYVSADMQ